MQKTLSVFLSFVMLFTCLCVGGVSAQAAEKKTKITYLYEPETQTLYIRGKGVIPEKFLGWDTFQYEDYLESELYAQEGYVLSWHDDADVDHSYSSRELDDEINLRRIYPEPYVSITRHVKKLVIEEGITRISRFAFSYSFPNLQKVVFPSTLRSIADCAFAICKMDCVVFPANLETVDNFAFDANVSNCIFLGKKTKVSDLRVGDLAKHVYCYAGSAVEKQCKANLADKNPDIRKVNYSTIKTPAQVSGVKVSTTGSTVKLTWKKAKYANRYKVQRYVVSQKKWKTYATVTGTSYTFKNMAGSTNYRFRIIGVNRICDADFSGKASKECKAKTKFGKVLGVKVSDKNGTLSAKWNAVREAKSYQVYYATKKDGSYKKLGTATGTSFKKKVTKGKTYYVKVRAVKKNSKGKIVYGAYSDVKSVYVDW